MLLLLRQGPCPDRILLPTVRSPDPLHSRKSRMLGLVASLTTLALGFWQALGRGGVRRCYCLVSERRDFRNPRGSSGPALRIQVQPPTGLTNTESLGLKALIQRSGPYASSNLLRDEA